MTTRRSRPGAVPVFALLLFLLLFDACGGKGDDLSDAATARLGSDVAAIRTAVAAEDAAGAAAAVATLRQAVAELQQAGEITGERATEVLAAAAAVESQLDLLPAPAPPEPPPEPPPEDKEDRRGNDKDKHKGEGEEEDDDDRSGGGFRPRPGSPHLSPGGEELDALADGQGGLLPQGGVVVGGDGVGDDGGGIAGHPAGERQSASGVQEGVGQDRRRRSAGLLGADGVVQTARRAAPSVADRRDHPVTVHQVGEDVVGRRGTGVALAAADHFGHAVLGDEDLLDQVAEAVDPDLAVVEEPDPGARQGGEGGSRRHGRHGPF